jgi:hypothetical protein
MDKILFKKKKVKIQKKRTEITSTTVATFAKPDETAANKLTADVCIEPSRIEKLTSLKQFHFFH